MIQTEFDFTQGLTPVEKLDFVMGVKVGRFNRGEVEVTFPICTPDGIVELIFGIGPTLEIAAENAMICKEGRRGKFLS